MTKTVNKDHDDDNDCHRNCTFVATEDDYNDGDGVNGD